MELKFRELSAEHRRRIEEADAETLLRWSERILTANLPDWGRLTAVRVPCASLPISNARNKLRRYGASEEIHGRDTAWIAFESYRKPGIFP